MRIIHYYIDNEVAIRRPKIAILRQSHIPKYQMVDCNPITKLVPHLSRCLHHLSALWKTSNQPNSSATPPSRS